MKNYVCSLALLFISTAFLAQSKQHKINFTVGGGSQKYNGDLGNGFKFKNDVWYGTFSFNLNYYVNKSFDAGLLSTVGDYGYCQPDDKINKEIASDDRCPGCIGRVGLGNLNSRLASGGAMVRYKIANGYLLSEKSQLKPYVYAGMAFNRITDNMKMNCVNAGNYNSVNFGAGVRYYATERISLGYNLGFGYFTNDHVDYKMGSVNDMYMQNTVSVGIDLY